MRAGRSSALALVLGALGPSCFDGADALGLPCQSDDDCGNGQRCEQGFCGGPPATSTATMGSTGSSSESTSSSSGPDSTTAESTGPLPGCGNGVHEPELEEECDPGDRDSPECDADCTLAMCGDGYTNAAAAEDCDEQNPDDVDDCTTDCRATLFWDDMAENPEFSGNWVTDNPTYVDMDGMQVTLDPKYGWRWGMPDPGMWSSGLYSSSSGTSRLISRVIDFPSEPGSGFRYELRLRHRLRFDGNPQDKGPCTVPQTTDGGVVRLMDDEDMLRPAGPPPGAAALLEGGFCTMEPENPLYDPLMKTSVYSGITVPAFVDTGFPLPPDVAGTTARLVFEIGYDCSNCWEDTPQPGAGWTIDEVVVAAFPIP